MSDITGTHVLLKDKNGNYLFPETIKTNVIAVDNLYVPTSDAVSKAISAAVAGNKVFSPEEYCADSSNGTLLVTQTFAGANGQGGHIGSFELTGGSFFNYRFLKLDYKHYNHPEAHGSKVISVQHLRSAVQELSSAPTASTSNSSGFPLIADAFVSANISFYLYGYGSNGTTIYYAFHSLKELVIRGFN